jgi:hypothetical protein
MLWDVFISHASEDKDAVARPLARQLEAAGLRVWFDETQLRVGDSLRAKIDEGLSKSSFGVVIISPAFLEKRWPQRELAGFFARTTDREVLLPVWHGVSARQVAEVSPMMADLVAASTSKGLAEVATKIIEVAAPFLRRPDGGEWKKYSSNVTVPVDLIRRALDAIDTLAQPATWPYMNITAPGYPDAGWMGSDSSTLIEILHGFACPLFAYRALEYEARRNAALIDGRSRLIVALLEAAVELFTNEVLIAAVPPQIPYAPRVPDWRSKRMAEPARYWWQGLSPDRFDELRSTFLRTSTSGSDTSVVSAVEFREIYESLYSPQCPDRRQRQSLGLLANAFYGFIPRDRPVLWRVLAGQARLYGAILASPEFALEIGSSFSTDDLFCNRNGSKFPYTAPSFSWDTLYEPFESTVGATTSYLNAFVTPRLNAVVNSTVEH